jgi:hypothetical protein
MYETGIPMFLKIQMYASAICADGKQSSERKRRGKKEGKIVKLMV